MKNLLIYINPSHDFDAEHHAMARIQIDNCCRLGWNVDDVMVVTNFPFEYNGVKAIEVSDSMWCDWWKQVSKVNALLELFRLGVIDNELYWFHDFDAFQNGPIVDSELSLDGVDAGFTDYGYRMKWNTGSFFFRKSSEDMFKLIRDTCYELKTDEERALMELTRQRHTVINRRYRRMHVTYNFPGSKNGLRHLSYLYAMTMMYGLPVRVLHFHPARRRQAYLKALRGDNELNVKLMSDGLEEVFRHHGY